MIMEMVVSYHSEKQKDRRHLHAAASETNLQMPEINYHVVNIRLSTRPCDPLTHSKSQAHSVRFFLLFGVCTGL